MDKSLLFQTFKTKITKLRILECFNMFEITDENDKFDFIENLVLRGYKVEGAQSAFGKVKISPNYYI